jgi:hypothetical protein
LTYHSTGLKLAMTNLPASRCDRACGITSSGEVGHAGICTRAPGVAAGKRVGCWDYVRRTSYCKFRIVLSAARPRMVGAMAATLDDGARPPITGHEHHPRGDIPVQTRCRVCCFWDNSRAKVLQESAARAA